MKKRSHEICFRNVSNDWDSALPLGNGRFGAMVFAQDHVLHIAFNHYDCYYHVLPKFNSGDDTTGQTFLDPARFIETYESLCAKADLVRAQGTPERSHYGRTLHPGSGNGRPSYRGASYPVGGELLLELDERVDGSHSCLTLKIEQARITFEAGTGEFCVKAELLAAREKDALLIQLSQTKDHLWKHVEAVIPESVGLTDYHVARTVTEVENRETGDTLKQLCMHTVYGEKSDSKGGFLQELVFCLNKRKETGSEIRLTATASLMPGEGKAAEQAVSLMNRQQEEQQRHQQYWQQFWSGTVTLPDKFLERLWYMQLYLLECSSGKGSGYPEQACGLSGLWDIRRPNMWGSMWYWDINIQSAFWGSYTAGHPELTKLFCDGYLAYEQEIRSYTKKVYGIEGWALDYPHTLYHCIQPWCAQFLWKYYEYSQDIEFLEKKAYPVFRDQIAFFKKLAKRDEQGIYHILYDISPEQGPVTKDSVITISCIRKLLQMGIRACEILHGPAQEREEMAEILAHLPAYPLTKDGSRYKDSAMVQDAVFLRHPSVLMPLFPAEEIGVDSSPETAAYWENTLKYAFENTETGTFGMGWLSAAAARLGKGKSALRILYEKGLDYVIHANGLAYEESERFLNCCHMTKPVHFLPVMMESAGGIVNAVNMMLLQTGSNGEIRVFPAVPEDGSDILDPIVQYKEDDPEAAGSYAPWKDVSFSGLLAPGGFRVSAQRRNGVTSFLKIKSSYGGPLKLLLPGSLSENGKDTFIEHRMKAGEILSWGTEESAAEQNGFHRHDFENQEVLTHQAARTHRRVFLGEDSNTKFYKAVDAFTCGYLLGNELRYCRTPYIFDFGPPGSEKDYNDAYPRQIVMTGRSVLYTGGPRRVGAEEYCTALGYGFQKKEEIRGVDRRKPDDLRRDFLEGTEPAVFLLSLAKGKYDLLIVCGDEEEASNSTVSLLQHGISLRTGYLPAGRYASMMLPFVLERDGKIQLQIAGTEGRKWKLNCMFVNKEFGL